MCKLLFLHGGDHRNVESCRFLVRKHLSLSAMVFFLIVQHWMRQIYGKMFYQTNEVYSIGRGNNIQKVDAAQRVVMMV